MSAAEQSADLDLSTAVAMNLDEAVADGAIPDVGRWFERIFRFAESELEETIRPGASRLVLAFGAVRRGVLNVILSSLPFGAGSEAQKLPHFLVTDLT